MDVQTEPTAAVERGFVALMNTECEGRGLAFCLQSRVQLSQPLRKQESRETCTDDDDMCLLGLLMVLPFSVQGTLHEFQDGQHRTAISESVCWIWRSVILELDSVRTKGQ